MTRLAVIGAGAMGRNHARVLRDLLGEDLIAVADTDALAATQVAVTYGLRAYTSHRQLLEQERLEAVTVAVPTSAHHEVVRDALAAGCHVLVEKPIAATREQGEDLRDQARAVDRVLAVGHVERHNPAVAELQRQVAAGALGQVFEIAARRLGPFPLRVRDVGVVVDLATHDLDIMRMLTGLEPIRIYAETKREIHTSREDLLVATLRFENDVVGLLEINWLTPTKVRELYVTGDRGMFRVDYLTQDLYFYENAETSERELDPLAVLRGVSEGTMVRYGIRKVEPLRAEMQAFLGAIRGGYGPIATPEDGIAALQLAVALIEAANQHGPVELAIR